MPMQGKTNVCKCYEQKVAEVDLVADLHEAQVLHEMRIEALE